MEDFMKEFTHKKGGKIRVVYLKGVPYFVAVDVAKILGYKDLSGAIRKNVDAEDKKIVDLNRLPENQSIADAVSMGWVENFVVVINESGLWSLILRSRLEGAKEIKHWVTSEVLPSIRQNGYYIAPPAELPAPEDAPAFELETLNRLDKYIELATDLALRDELIKAALKFLIR